MKRYILMLLAALLCFAGLTPSVSAATVVVIGGGGYSYHGSRYRYRHNRHYYHHRRWIGRPGHRGYYRYW